MRHRRRPWYRRRVTDQCQIRLRFRASSMRCSRKVGLQPAGRRRGRWMRGAIDHVERPSGELSEWQDPLEKAAFRYRSVPSRTQVAWTAGALGIRGSGRTALFTFAAQQVAVAAYAAASFQFSFLARPMQCLRDDPDPAIPNDDPVRPIVLAVSGKLMNLVGIQNRFSHGCHTDAHG